VDALYALPLAEFTRARQALATRLRQAGQAERAAEVQRLSKPTPVTWAVNQLARRDPSGVERLLAAVQELRAAQTRRPTEALAGAADAERVALRQLRERAGALLREAGFAGSEGMLERVAATLLGAASAPESAEALRRGRLAQELERPGFEVLAGARIAPPAAPAPGKRTDTPAARRVDARIERAREAARVAQAEATEAKRRAEALERAAAEAARTASEAAEAAGRAARAAADARREQERAARKATEKADALRAAESR
jgi:hypothetical protein